MAEWFYGKDNAQHGPVSEPEIHNLIATGQIEPSTIIWREGMQNWLPLKDVPEFQVTNAQLSSTSTIPGSNQTYAPPQAYMQPPPSDGLAITSMILGIISILASCMYIGIIFGIPAVICGHMSLNKINKSPVAIGGKGMAIAGLVTGYLGSLTSLIVIAFVVIAIGAANNIPAP